MRIAVILPAAGLGKRFNGSDAPSERSKIELDLAGRPIFLRAIELFLNRAAVSQIILAVQPDSLDEFKFRWGDKLAFHNVTLVPGGKAERWETVLKALDAARPDCTHVAVHDAARPLASRALIDRVFEAAGRFTAVIPGLPVSATLKRVAVDESASQATDPLDAILGGAGKPGGGGEVRRVVATVDRAGLVEVQTPQVFEVQLFRRAYAQITDGRLASGTAITDDAGLIEALGEPVRVVEGEATNLKITRPDDLKLAEAYASAAQQEDAAALSRKRLFKDEDE
jgi:2-C-methyl-D-erythritol 4-phosphate cytidylyltransferase